MNGQGEMQRLETQGRHFYLWLYSNKHMIKIMDHVEGGGRRGREEGGGGKRRERGSWLPTGCNLDAEGLQFYNYYLPYGNRFKNT